MTNASCFLFLLLFLQISQYWSIRAGGGDDFSGSDGFGLHVRIPGEEEEAFILLNSPTKWPSKPL